MDADFPAAHSMDTEWFAVDAQGHVAIFNSGENGHVPSSSESEVTIEQLWRLFHPSAAENDDDIFDEIYEDFAQSTAKIGLFSYNYGEEFDPIGTYWRKSEPGTPLHIDQLPPAVRGRIRSLSFDKLNFADAVVIQPLEWKNCVYWYEEDRVAYLASDEITVRPIPGLESRFAEFAEQFRRENPELAAKYRFEATAASAEMGDTDGQ